MTEKLVFLFAERSFERPSKVLGSTLVSFAKIFKGKKICIVQRIFSAISEVNTINDSVFKEEANRLAKSMKLSSHTPFCTYASIGEDDYNTGFNREIDLFLTKTVEHILIDLKTDDYHQYFELFFENEKEKFNESKIIYIESYVGCEFIIKAVEKKEFMNIIFDRSGQDCYSDYISSRALKLNKYIKSVAIITSKNEIGGKYCYFNAEKNLVEIVKNSEHRVPFLFKWIELLYQDFNYYYSYASDDDVQDIIDGMIYFFKLKMPFANYNIDSQENKSFTDIERYVSKLINGKMIVALIGDNYLFKPYPMFEIISILEKHNLFIINNDLIFTNVEKVDLLTMENKIFPILFGKKAHAIFRSDKRNEISDYWRNFSDSSYSEDKINKIKQFISPTLEILSRLNYQALKELTQSNSDLLKNHELICKILVYQANFKVDIYSHINAAEEL